MHTGAILDAEIMLFFIFEKKCVMREKRIPNYVIF